MTQLATKLLRRHPPRGLAQGAKPALKIPQNTYAVTSTGYRSASATEFRDSMGIAAGLSGPNYPTPTIRAFWCGELQYIGIRQLRFTPITNDNNYLQFCRDWANTQVGTGFGRLMVEPGYLTNDWAVSRGCTGVKDSNGFRTIDYVMNLLLSDPDIRKAINVFELTNEPDNFQCDKFVPYPPSTSSADGSGPASQQVCDYFWHDKYGWTWLECLGEYTKKVFQKYVMGDPRCAGMQTVAPCPTKMVLDDSEFDANVPDGADVKTQWGDVLPYVQYGNDHPYCGYTLPGKVLAISNKGQALPGANGFPGMIPGHGAFPSLRQMPSEFGHNVGGRPGVNQSWADLPDFDVHANFMLRNYLEAFIRGYERFYWFKLDNEGDHLPRGSGPPDDFTMYAWNGTGTSASVTNWNIRTQSVEMMHRMTTTVGDGVNEPNITWSVTSPPSDLRWLMLRNSSNHVLFLWRFVSFLQQAGVPLGETANNNSFPPPDEVVPAPETVHVNFPDAISVTETHPIDGAPPAYLSFSGSGASRGVDVTLRQKPFLLVIDKTVFSPGLTSGSSSDDLTATQDLGAKEVRVEFDIQTAATSIDSVVDAYADIGTRVLLLADFAGYMPTVGQAQNLGTWATRFGPGGTFWASRSDGHLAVQSIEFGNETSGGYQYGNDGPGDATYIQRAKDYASRFVSAHGAIAATGKPVGLLCNADDGGTGSSSWVDNMYVQVPTLHTYVSAWVCHPYGPSYVAKNTTMISQVAAHGAPATVPIDITECGIASDNGANLDANHGWATNMTYATAASTLSTIVSTLRGHATVGPRLRRFMLYQVHDQSNPGADNGGEHYYGAVKHDLSAKGAYTTQARTLLASV